MKILFVAEVFYPENFLINDLAPELVKRGYEVEVLTRQPSYPDGIVYPGYSNEPYSKEVWKGVTVHRFKTIEGYKTSKVKKIQNYYHYVKEGKKVIQRIWDGVDVIFVYHTGPLTLALPAVFARQQKKIPTMIWTFDIWPDAVYMYGFPKVFPLTTFLTYVIKKVFGNMDAILVSSRKFTDTIHEYVDKEIDYAPNWQIEGEQRVSELRLPKGKVNFTFTGNVSKAQNLENVIKGFAQANVPDAVLNIVGDGSTLQQHKVLAEELKLTNVVFHGRRPFAEMHDILVQSDFLLLSLISNEGIEKTEPLKIQSYLKAGKPIFGVINGAGREIIEENELGLCAAPDDVAEIAEGFRRMMTLSEEDKSKVVAKAKVLMEGRFNRERIIAHIEQKIKEVAAKKL